MTGFHAASMARPASSTGFFSQRALLLGLLFQRGEALGEIGGLVGLGLRRDAPDRGEPVAGRRPQRGDVGGKPLGRRVRPKAALLWPMAGTASGQGSPRSATAT